MLQLKIEKIVPGGRSLAHLDDGRVCFVWGALPGEVVEVEITKKKRNFLEAITKKVLSPSEHRVEARDDAYLSTSPWQIVSFDEENKLKQQMISEVFTQHDVALPSFSVLTDQLVW